MPCPGSAGVTGLILLLPFTHPMEPVSAFALMLGMFAVTTTSDTIASVMLGIPGTVASQATILDGYPLAQMGQANRALGAAYTCSAIGGVIGAVVLMFSLPGDQADPHAVSTPEFFMLSLLGICMVGSLSGSSVTKGLVIGAVGMMLGTIGEETFTQRPATISASSTCSNTPPLVAVVLGLFAIPELLELATKNTSISRVPNDQSRGGGMLQGIRDAIANWWLVIKGSVLGVYIGMLPGLGASIVDWAAYGMAVQTTKGENKFGRGDIRGVIRARVGQQCPAGRGAHPDPDLRHPRRLRHVHPARRHADPGIASRRGDADDEARHHLRDDLDLIVANIASAISADDAGRQVAKAIFVDGHLLVPVVVLFVFMGSWLGNQSWVI